MITLSCRVPGRWLLGTAVVLAFLTLLALGQSTSAQETHQDLLPSDPTSAAVTAAGASLRTMTDRGHQLLAQLERTDLRPADLRRFARVQPLVAQVETPVLGALTQTEPVVTPESAVETPPLGDVALQPVVTPESAVQLPVLTDVALQPVVTPETALQTPPLNPVALLQPVVTPESAVQLPDLTTMTLLQPVVTPESTVHTPVLGAIAWVGPVVDASNAVQVPALGSTAVQAPVVPTLTTPSLTTIAPTTTTPVLTLIPGEALLRGSLLPVQTPIRDATAGAHLPTWQPGACLTLPDQPTLSPCAQPLLATSPGTTDTSTTDATTTTPLPTTGGVITNLPVTGSGPQVSSPSLSPVLALLLGALACLVTGTVLLLIHHPPQAPQCSQLSLPRPGRLTFDDSRFARAAAAASREEVPRSLR